MKFGAIELSNTLGGYDIVNIPASKIPQDAASAVWGAINSGLLGATYAPLWYIGSQVVNGKNHLFIAKEIRSTKNRDTAIVGLVVNVPPSKDAFKGEGAKIVNIIEEADLSEELSCLFDSTMRNLIGVGYTPLFYVGHQVVKGTNHYFIAQAKGVYPGAEPYAVMICINEFQKVNSIVSIEKIEDVDIDDRKLGYAFTW